MNDITINSPLKDFKLDIITLCQNIVPDVFEIKSDIIGYGVYDIQFDAIYGDRIISNFLYLIHNYESYSTENDRVHLGSLTRTLILQLLESKFKDKWKKLNDLWNIDYDPLSPFDITLSETKTDTLDVKKDKTSSSSEDMIYGFNSTQPVPSDSYITERSDEYLRENPSTRDYTRKGNIGNTSRQELIEKQREVLKYQIIDTIYSDIASVLCRNKYI